MMPAPKYLFLNFAYLDRVGVKPFSLHQSNSSMLAGNFNGVASLSDACRRNYLTTYLLHPSNQHSTLLARQQIQCAPNVSFMRSIEKSIYASALFSQIQDLSFQKKEYVSHTDNFFVQNRLAQRDQVAVAANVQTYQIHQYANFVCSNSREWRAWIKPNHWF